MSSTMQVCTFELDGFLLGVEVLEVQEVMKAQTMTSVPTSPEVVRGLINLRGQIVTAIDLRRRLGLRPSTDSKAPMNVVIRTLEGPVSLLVDAIGDVLSVPESSFENTPENLIGPARDLILGVFKLEKRLLLVLNVERILNLQGSSAGRGETES